MALVMLLLVAACAPPPRPEANTALAGFSRVASVSVLLDKQMLTAEQQRFLTANDITSRLRQSIRKRLEKRGDFDAGGSLRLVVTIFSYDLRNDVEALVLWPLREADWMDARVSVYCRWRMLGGYTVHGHNTQGGIFATVGSKARLAQVIASVSYRIVQGLGVSEN